jgi:hypothetical protein
MTINNGTLGREDHGDDHQQWQAGDSTTSHPSTRISTSSIQPFAYPAVAPTTTQSQRSPQRTPARSRARCARRTDARQEIAPNSSVPNQCDELRSAAPVREIERIHSVWRDDRSHAAPITSSQDDDGQMPALSHCASRVRGSSTRTRDVRDEIQHDDGDRRTHQERHEYGVVTSGKRFREQAADAGPREDTLPSRPHPMP